MVKKVILILLGLFALFGGLVLIVIGTAVLALGGRSGTIQSGYHAVQTPTVALVSDPADVRNNTNTGLHTGSATLRVDGRNVNEPVFIGVGPASQVDSYLAGAPYDVVTDVNFGPYRLTTRRVDGNFRPALPGDQTFWVAQASGITPRLTWPISNGNYRVVVMNVDASPGVALDARIGLKIPALYGIGLGTLISGLLLTLIGLALIIWGIMARRRDLEPVPVRPGYPGTATYPPPATAPPDQAGPAPGTPPGTPNPVPDPYANPTPGQPPNPMPGLSPTQPPNPMPGQPPDQPPTQPPNRGPIQ